VGTQFYLGIAFLHLHTVLTHVPPSYLAALSLAGCAPPPQGISGDATKHYYCLTSEDLRDDLQSEARDVSLHRGREPDHFLLYGFFIRGLRAEILTAGW